MRAVLLEALFELDMEVIIRYPEQGASRLCGFSQQCLLVSYFVSLSLKHPKRYG